MFHFVFSTLLPTTPIMRIFFFNLVKQNHKVHNVWQGFLNTCTWQIPDMLTPIRFRTLRPVLKCPFWSWPWAQDCSPAERWTVSWGLIYSGAFIISSSLMSLPVPINHDQRTLFLMVWDAFRTAYHAGLIGGLTHRWLSGKFSSIHR